MCVCVRERESVCVRVACHYSDIRSYSFHRRLSWTLIMIDVCVCVCV